MLTKQGTTYSVIGAGRIEIRDPNADTSVLTTLKRTTDGRQVVTVDTKSGFSLDIPPVDFQALADTTEKIGNFLNAIGAPVPAEVSAQGDEAITLYRQMLARGMTAEEATAFASSEAFEKIIETRKAAREAIARFPDDPERIARIIQLTADGERIAFDPITQQPIIVTNCNTASATPCGVPLDQLSKLTREDVQSFITRSLEVLGDENANQLVKDANTKSAYECAMAWYLQADEPNREFARGLVQQVLREVVDWSASKKMSTQLVAADLMRAQTGGWLTPSITKLIQAVQSGSGDTPDYAALTLEIVTLAQTDPEAAKN